MEEIQIDNNAAPGLRNSITQQYGWQIGANADTLLYMPGFLMAQFSAPKPPILCPVIDMFPGCAGNAYVVICVCRALGCNKPQQRNTHASVTARFSTP